MQEKWKHLFPSSLIPHAAGEDFSKRGGCGSSVSWITLRPHQATCYDNSVKIIVHGLKMSGPLRQEQQWKVDLVKGSKQGKYRSINMVDVPCLSL